MNAQNLTPIHDGDFTLPRRVLIRARQGAGAGACCLPAGPSKPGAWKGCWAPLPAHHVLSGLPYLSLLPIRLWRGWFFLLGKCHGSGDADAGDKQMRLFFIPCCCAMAPELETLPTSFPLLPNTGVGMTICIVIYKHCKTLPGPTCINLALALAFFVSLASLQHSFCLCCTSVRLSAAETPVLLVRAPVGAAAMLLLRGEPWEPAAHPASSSHGPAAAARCLSAARTAGIANSRREMPRASLYGSIFPVHFLWDFLSIQIYERARLASEAQEPPVGSGRMVAEPGGEPRCRGGDRAGGLPGSPAPTAGVARARRAAPSASPTGPALLPGTKPRCHRRRSALGSRGAALCLALP